ncbi:MAG: hypothetical protein ACJ8GW_00015 [Massilia sp.]
MTTPVHDIDYFSLPTPMQDALKGAFAVGGGSSTIVSDAPPVYLLLFPRLLVGLFVLAFPLALVSLGGVAEMGAMRPWQTFELARTLIVAATFALPLYGILSAWFRLRMHKALPFRPGRYLLPFALIDAREPTLRIYDLRKLKEIRLIHNSINFIYVGSTFIFSFHGARSMRFKISGKRKAEDALERLHDLQEEGARASSSQDLETLQWIDPLFPLRARDWKPYPPVKGRTAPTVPALLKNRLPAAVGFGLVAAALLAGAGWIMEDRAQYAWATRTNTDLGYQHYLEHGKLYRSAVKAIHPRVAFDEAYRAKNIGRLQRLNDRFPTSGLGPEIKAAIDHLSAPATAVAPEVAP